VIKLEGTLLEGLDKPRPDVESVHAALQSAIELEHATIPLYLYALYSLDVEKNRELTRILKSVVVEEMLHMVLAANVLNALGGSPVIDRVDFIPTYPGRLPGGVEDQLVLHLRRYSPEQLESFIEIEEPRNPIDFQAGGTDEVGTSTIGEFYTAIAGAIERMGDEVFAPTPRNQVGPDLMFGSIEVLDVASALRALDTIIEQGEGTGTSPMEIDGPNGTDDFAHYYRLMELKMGRKLVKRGRESEFAYVGDDVGYDESAVHDVPSDPTSVDYPDGSVARQLNDRFNYTYTTLLVALHDLVNGHADMPTFIGALDLMKSLERQARAMVADPSGPVGPSFEYQPVEPSVGSGRLVAEPAS
jgi:Ferritin-like